MVQGSFVKARGKNVAVIETQGGKKALAVQIERKHYVLEM